MKSIETLLSVRTAELRTAQAILTKVDDVTDAEVLAILNNVNSLIFQTSAAIADTPFDDGG